MTRLFALKDDEGEFYAQVELTKDVWALLDDVAMLLFDENWMVDDHYRGELRDNDHFSHGRDGVWLTVIMSGGRAHIVVLGLPDNAEVKEAVMKRYSF